MSRFWPRFWITAGYLGFCPGVPGTWGTLGGVALVMLATRYTHVPGIRAAVIASLILLFSGVTLIYGEWAEQAFGRKDPPQAVSDEVAGFLLTMLLVPSVRPGMEWFGLALGFLLFRAFDILKPPPIRGLQRLPGGLGILADDLAAGLLANACLQVLLRGPLLDFVPYVGL